MRFQIKDIKANPFRNAHQYPIRRNKIEALRKSIRTNSFWDNIVARKVGSKAEIAYGHHRLEALREEFPPDHEVDLIIRDLNDEQMLRVMAAENQTEWTTVASVEHESIRVVVDAYAKGKIKLQPPPPGTNKSRIRYAPSFIQGKADGADRQRPYTAKTVASFLGWTEPAGRAQEKVHSALAALQFIEEEILTESDFEDLTTKQAQALVEETRKVRKPSEDTARVHLQEAERAKLQAHNAATPEDRERAARLEETARQRARVARTEGSRRAKDVGRKVSTELKSGKIGYRRVRTMATAAEPGGVSKGLHPDYLQSIRRLISEVNGILDPGRDRKARLLREAVKVRELLPAAERGDIERALDHVRQRATGFRKRFRESQTLKPKDVSAPTERVG